eukprot:10954333-Lingulodinium_polyedra.AAC.1
MAQDPAQTMKSCPACSSLFPVESFFGNVYEDDHSWVQMWDASLAATADIVKGQAVQHQGSERAVGRYCVYCIGEFHGANYLNERQQP